MESRQHDGEGVRQIFEIQRFTVKCFPFSFSLFPFFLFLLLSLFFLFQSVKILRSSIFWRVAEIVENKFLYKNIKNKGKKILIKSRGEISTQIYFPIIYLYMHTLLRGKKTPDHKSPDHKRSKKKNKRNNKNLLTNRKQCYIIQSSTRDKRNKKQETQL